VDEVRDARLDATQEPRHRPRHPQLLRAGRQHERLDSFGHERRVAGDRGDPLVALQVGERTEKVRDVRLVAGAVAAEHVGVDHDHSAAS
jgi:hypothetical protein